MISRYLVAISMALVSSLAVAGADPEKECVLGAAAKLPPIPGLQIIGAPEIKKEGMGEYITYTVTFQTKAVGYDVAYTMNCTRDYMSQSWIVGDLAK